MHNDFMITSARQEKALNKAASSLDKAWNSINNKREETLISIDIREALDALGELVGDVTNEDILNSIFEKFCVGK